MEQLYYIFSKYYHYMLFDTKSHTHPNTVDMLIKKFIHTFRVLDNAKCICYKENMPPNIIRLAEVSALFHDIGRFEQAVKYGHFNDSTSFDHGESSADIFISYKEGLLKCFNINEIHIIEEAIRWHNKIGLPEEENEEVILISKILKDADKIDILSINLKSDFIKFDGMPENFDTINEACIKDFYNHKIIKTMDVKSGIDNKIKYLSWIFSMNFKTSLDMYLDEGFIDILTSTTKIKDDNIKKEIILMKEYVLSYLKENKLN